MKPRSRSILSVPSAFLVTAGLIAVVFGLMSQSVQLANLVLIVALVHLVPAALLYSILAWKNKINWFSCLASGFIIGALPIGIWTFPLRYSDLNTNSWVAGTQTMADGVPTLAGWIEYGGLLLFFGSIGTIGGLIFWRLIRKRHFIASERTDVTEVQSQACTWANLSGTILPLVAILLVGGVSLAPVLTKDRSCHNLLRDARNHASPELVIDLTIPKDSWENLHYFFESFSSGNSLEFRGLIDDSQSSVSVLSLSMCKEPGFAIRSNEQYWTHRGDGPIPGRGISIAVFSLYEETDWVPLARKLVDGLNDQWPTNVQFRDGGGHIIPMEETALGHPRGVSTDES